MDNKLLKIGLPIGLGVAGFVVAYPIMIALGVSTTSVLVVVSGKMLFTHVMTVLMGASIGGISKFSLDTYLKNKPKDNKIEINEEYIKFCENNEVEFLYEPCTEDLKSKHINRLTKKHKLLQKFIKKTKSIIDKTIIEEDNKLINCIDNYIYYCSRCFCQIYKFDRNQEWDIEILKIVNDKIFKKYYHHLIYEYIKEDTIRTDNIFFKCINLQSIPQNIVIDQKWVLQFFDFIIEYNPYRKIVLLSQIFIDYSQEQEECGKLITCDDTMDFAIGLMICANHRGIECDIRFIRKFCLDKRNSFYDYVLTVMEASINYIEEIEI